MPSLPNEFLFFFTLMGPKAEVAALELIEESPESVHFVLERSPALLARISPRRFAPTPFLGSMQCLIEAEKASGRVTPEVDTHRVRPAIGALGQIARIAHFRELPKQPSAMADDLFNLIEHGPGCYITPPIEFAVIPGEKSAARKVWS